MSNFDYSKVKDPQYFQENRLPAHSDHSYYASVEELNMESSSFRHSLNGLWRFSYAPNYEAAVKGFERMDIDCKGWAQIRVPAHIQMEGYDAPHYANVEYPWDGWEQIEPGQIPEYFNPVASYVKYFEIPTYMQEKPVYISFQGVESAMALWCNGQFVGYSEDSFTPSEFDLTPYLTEGENKLAVQVYKWCAGSWCEDQDFFRFSGIFRDVYLYTVPDIHIWDIRQRALLDSDLCRGSLEVELQSAGNGGTVSLTLSGENGIEADVTGKLQDQSHFSLEILQPDLWSAEAPNLYELLITVMDQTGKVCEVISQKVGFRRFEIRDSLMLLNGKRIVFRGVNRHEFNSLSGRVMSEEDLRQDLITMKRNNINAIRTCHYPNNSLIYRLCDELGFYMIDECNLESHGSWAGALAWKRDLSEVVPGDRPQWLDLVLDRANSMYQRDKNHPAILIWSLGNEAFGGRNIYEMSRFFHRVDPDRIVHYEGIFNDRRYPGTSDVESQMYTPAEKIAQFLKENRSKPFICCEYTHAMGNSCGGMHKYTDLTDTEPLYQGGFIWDYIDQSITKKDRYGQEFQAYGGDFGDRPSDYNFSGNGIAYGGDRKPSPKMQEVKFNYQSISVKVGYDQIHITNKNLFLSTSEYDCLVLLEKEGRPIDRRLLPTDVKPGCTECYPSPVSFPEELGEYTVTVSFRLRKNTAWAKAGHEVAFGQGVFSRLPQEPRTGLLKTATGYIYLPGTNDGTKTAIFTDVPVASGKAPQMMHGSANVGVRGENFEAMFSAGKVGGMSSYRYGGKEFIRSIPMPNFWRAPVDNDCGSSMMCQYGQWKLASMYATHKDATPFPEIRKEEDSVVVAYKYKLPTSPAAECDLTYRIFGDGTVAVTLGYDPVPELGDMPEFGVMFKVDADYDCLEWYGNGPEESYADRKQGARIGLHRNRVTDNMAKYLVPQECGNKTEVRFAKVTDRLGRGLVFAGDRMYFSALPYTPHELENAMHPYELPPVHYTVIRASLGQMGVAGDDSWGARPHPEYLLNVDKRMEFTFYFKGI